MSLTFVYDKHYTPENSDLSLRKILILTLKNQES